MRLPRLSRPLLLMILVPTLSGVLMLLLVLVAFKSAWDMVVKEQEREAEEIVELAASAIEELWVAPRRKAIEALADSPTLERRIEGQVPFDALAQEWRIAEELLQGYFFIYYGLRDGTIEHYPDGELPADFNPRERPWYEAGMSAESGPAWTSPYEEAITGELVVSTAAPLYQGGERVGVISTDIQFDGLKAILEGIELPTGGSVFLVDSAGRPFVGTDTSYIGQNRLPPSDAELFVTSSAPISNGWRTSVIVPRAYLAESFAELLQPLMIASALILLLGGGITSLLVARTASRAYRLAGYFQRTLEQDAPLQEIFRTRDEFSLLNARFNQVLDQARETGEQRLAQERAFRFLVEQAPVGFFRSNHQGELLYINSHCASLLGYTQDEAMRELTSVRQLYADGTERDRFLEDLLTHSEVRNRKMRFVKRSGDTLWISMTARLREDTEADEAGGFELEGFVIDVTGEVEERESLIQMAERDPLTGVGNRRAFDAVAETVADRAHTTGQQVALIVFDIDHFKAINDTYGHDTGDTLLRQIAELGKNRLRDGDLFARLGGDEFAVLLPGASEEAAAHLAERLRAGTEGIPLPGPVPEPPTLSIGIAVRAGTEVQVSELFKAADSAMYEAKRAGRNGWSTAGRRSPHQPAALPHTGSGGAAPGAPGGAGVQ